MSHGYRTMVEVTNQNTPRKSITCRWGYQGAMLPNLLILVVLL